MRRQFLSVCLIAAIVTGPVLTPVANAANPKTTTPIKHIVIIFGENRSFDHYFGTYPNALNPKGEPQFHALPGTPTVNGLSKALLINNPNLNPLNGSGAANPFRFDRSQANTQDMDHDYMAEQLAFDGGVMDLFPANTGSAGPPPSAPPAVVLTTGQVMGYFDGNTVTAFWNYAQHYAMSDNSYSTNFGPSTVGAINLISGQTNGVAKSINGTGGLVGDGSGGMTLIGDPDPLNDVCSGAGGTQAQMGGKNIGDLLNAAGITWGWFAGGFNLQTVNSDGSTGCNRDSTSPIVGTQGDYVPHHTPFQYYASTANPTHARPRSVATIGHSGDPANHDYDVDDFFTAVQAGNFPAGKFPEGHLNSRRPSREFRSSGRAGIRSQGSQLPARPAGVDQHRASRALRRFRWLVRSSARPDCKFIEDRRRCSHRSRNLRQRRKCATRPQSIHHPRSGPLRIRSASTAPRHLPLGEAQLRGSFGHRSNLGHSLYRGQLARRPTDRPRIV